MERHYETVCIIRPDAGDDIVKGVIAKATSVLATGNAKVNKVDEWGRRRLAYPIRKKHEGFYFVLDYVAAPAASKELERTLRYNEDVMRYQTVTVVEAPAAPAPEAKEAAKTEGGEHGGKE